MKKVKIHNIAELAYILRQEVKEDNCFVAAIGCYDDMRKLAQELCRYDDVDFVSADFSQPEMNDYDWEYSVSLSDDLGLWVEKTYNPEKEIYLSGDEEKIFIMPDCNRAILEKHKEALVREVEFADGKDTECINCAQHFAGDYEPMVTLEAEDLSGKLADLFLQQNEILREAMQSEKLNII